MPTLPPPPFLGNVIDRESELQGFERITINISQDPYKQYLQHDWQRSQTFDKSNFPARFPCANKRCIGGGADLEKMVHFFPSGEFSFGCDGHEGTAKRKGDACDNRFKVTLAVKKTGDAA